MCVHQTCGVQVLPGDCGSVLCRWRDHVSWIVVCWCVARRVIFYSAVELHGLVLWNHFCQPTSFASMSYVCCVKFLQVTLEGIPDGGQSLKSLCDEAGSWYMVDCVLWTLGTFDLLLKNSFWIAFLDCCSTRRLSRNILLSAWLRVNVLEHWNRRIVFGCCFLCYHYSSRTQLLHFELCLFLCPCYRDVVSVVDRVGDLWSERCCPSRFARFTAAAAAVG